MNEMSVMIIDDQVGESFWKGIIPKLHRSGLQVIGRTLNDFGISNIESMAVKDLRADLYIIDVLNQTDLDGVRGDAVAHAIRRCFPGSILVMVSGNIFAAAPGVKGAKKMRDGKHVTYKNNSAASAVDSAGIYTCLPKFQLFPDDPEECNMATDGVPPEPHHYMVPRINKIIGKEPLISRFAYDTVHLLPCTFNIANDGELTATLLDITGPPLVRDLVDQFLAKTANKGIQRRRDGGFLAFSRGGQVGSITNRTVECFQSLIEKYKDSNGGNLLAPQISIETRELGGNNWKSCAISFERPIVQLDSTPKKFKFEYVPPDNGSVSKKTLASNKTSDPWSWELHRLLPVPHKHIERASVEFKIGNKLEFNRVLCPRLEIYSPVAQTTVNAKTGESKQ